MSIPRLLISYSHDSEAHRQAVLELANRLREDGVDARIDQFVNGSPPEGWPRWMLNELEGASHVLCVCTSTYYERFRGRSPTGKGANWEGAIITQELYDNHGKNRKFFPVLFEGGQESAIPEPLRPVTHYRLPSAYEALYDAILGQAGEEPAPLGTLKIKPRRKSGQRVPPKDSLQPAPSPTEDDLAGVFANVVTSMEDTLKTAPTLARFLGPEAPSKARFVAQKSGAWTVLPEFRQGGVDVCPILDAIRKRLSGFRAARQEWDGLEQIVGGILVLGLSPRWVWEQRQRLTNQEIKFPRHATDITLGQEGLARFLPILAAALAEGCARVERVFGALDGKSIPDLNPVGKEITLERRHLEMKRHFIRYVLGPSDEFDPETLPTDELNTLFRRVRQILTVAHRVDQDPILGSGPRMAALATEIKQHLEMADFFLFVPEEQGDEFDLMTDPVIALTHLKRIHDFVQRERPNI